MPRLPTRYSPAHPRLVLKRLSPSARGYDWAWQRIRLSVLNEEPLCRDCMSRGVLTEATEVDHVVALAKGGTNDRDNLAPLCKPCHSRKTNREDIPSRRQ